MVQEFCLSDTLWERLSPHLPAHTPKVHPLGSHRRRVPDRQVLDGSFFVLRTGCQWQARSATGICSSRTAHNRFQAWVQAGVSARLFLGRGPARLRGRNHSWLNRFRYLLIRWAKKPENYLAMLQFACARITWYNCLFG